MLTRECIEREYMRALYGPETAQNARDFALWSIALEALEKGSQAAKKRLHEHLEEMDSPLTMEEAETWVANMENEDASKPHGGKWSYTETTAVAKKHGIPEDKFVDFYAAMNMIWSDYYKVATELNVSTPDFYAKMAKAFVCDKDAAPNKVARYYRAIPE